MHTFDYSFLGAGSIPASVVNLISHIAKESGLTAVRKNLHPNVFSGLERIARIQSVKSSNAIEGIVTSDDRLRALVLNDTAPLNHNEAEIAGYRDVLAEIHAGYAGIRFNETAVLAMHRHLLEKTGYEYGGTFKASDNVIMERDELGRKQVRFRPVSAAETPQAMEQLVLAYAEASADSAIHPLLLIPCVILDFLCIHPFRDGNGRMSRLLSLLLLYQAGYDIGRYISFEEAINRDKDAYYEALKQSSAGWHDNREDPFPFIEHFLRMLAACYTEMETRFRTGSQLSKTARIEQFADQAFLPFGKADVCAAFPEISPTTVEAVLGKLVKAGRIEKTGAGRGTKYVPAGK